MSSPPQERKSGAWIGLSITTGFVFLLSAIPGGISAAFEVRARSNSVRETVIFGALYALVQAIIGGLLFRGGTKAAKLRSDGNVALIFATGIALLVAAIPGGIASAAVALPEDHSWAEERIVFAALFALVLVIIGGLLAWVGARIGMQRHGWKLLRSQETDPKPKGG